VRATHREGVDLFSGVEHGCRIQRNVLYPIYVCTDLNSESGEYLAGDASGYNSASRLAGGRSASSAVISKTILGVIGVIGVGGTISRLKVVIIL
jgi:hypothetical protein